MERFGPVSKDEALAAAVIPRGAVIVSDWSDVLINPREHLSEVVRIRDDVDPERPVADFTGVRKGTAEALGLVDILWAGELNGKTVGSLLSALGASRLRTVAKVFFADTSILKDSVASKGLDAEEHTPKNVSPVESKTGNTKRNGDAAKKTPDELLLCEYLKKYKCLSSVDIKTLVTQVLNRLKVRDTAEARVAVEVALSSDWCARNLKISGPLLKKIEDGESAADYAPDYISFSPIHTQYLITEEHPHLDVPAFAEWALDADIPLDRIFSLLKSDVANKAALTRHSRASYVQERPDAEEEKKRRMEFLRDGQWMQDVRRETENAFRTDIEQEHEERCRIVSEMADAKPTRAVGPLFEEDIKTNYPTGFDFKESSVRLVESRIGTSIGSSLIAGWKLEMFARPDGLYFFPDMIMDDTARGQMLTRAEELLSSEGMFALDALWAEFSSEMKNISDANDFKAYFNQYIAEKIGGKVRGHIGWQMCFLESMREEDGWNDVATRVRKTLADAGDAVSLDDLQFQLPTLNREIIKRVGEERIADAVSFEMEGVFYLKLLEAYYLPDDFCTAISDFVRATEENQSVTSVILLEGMLNERYGEGFRTNYGLEDEAVFKQVVSRSAGLEEHEWKRDMYVSRALRSKANVVEMFLKEHEGLFHEGEFFAFAEESRGMTNRGMLICTFLRKYCIRMAKDWWISTKAFDEQFNLSEEQYSQIGICLNNAVSGKSFCPIASIPQSYFETLPRLRAGDRQFDWNPYLLTSIAVARVRNAIVVNDEPSPYTVTAFVVPSDVEVPSDVVEYALGSMPKGFFTDADSAFEYLKANNVRMTRTDKLMAKINDFLGC